MATASNNSFGTTIAGSRTTPTINGTRVAIVQDGNIVGYRETVVVTQPTVINQLYRQFAPDLTPKVTYTIDYDLNGARTSGNVRLEGGFINTIRGTEPAIYVMESNGSLRPLTPDTPRLPDSVSANKFPDYSPFQYSDFVGAAGEGLGNGGLTGIATGAGNTAATAIDNAGLGNAALSGDTRGVVAEGGGIIGTGVALAGGAPFIQGLVTVTNPGVGVLFAGFLAYAGNQGGKGLVQGTFEPYDGYIYHNGGPINEGGINRPAGWYTDSSISGYTEPASPAKAAELTTRQTLVENTRVLYGNEAADLVSRMDNDQLRSFAAQNPTDPLSSGLIVPHLSQAGFGSAPVDVNSLPLSQPLNPRDGFTQGEIASTNQTAPNGQTWGTTVSNGQGGTVTLQQGSNSGYYLRSTEIPNNGNITRIVEVIDSATGRASSTSTYERSAGQPISEGRIVGITNHETGVAFSLNRATGQMEQSTLPASSATGNEVAAPPRPPSSTFITQVDSDHVSLVPGGTVSDIVNRQNAAGNPITAADIRAANPELNLNADLTNVPAGASLLVPTRVGDNLVTNLPGGGTQSVNTRTQDITTDVPNANGTRTQTTSSSDGEFTRTVRSITYNADGEITLESRYSLNTLDGTRTEIPLIPAPSPTTGPANSTDSAAPAPADTPLTDEQISIIRGEDATTGGSANTSTSAPAPILVADAGSHAGGAIVSDAGGGAPSTTESTAPVSTSNPPLPVIEPAPNAPEIIVDSAPPASVIPAIPAAPAAPANDFSLNNFLGGAGSGLTPAQQTALANQLDGMGLGGANDLQFFPLPGGGALIQNVDGEIVGEIAPRSDGTLSISGNTVNTDGSSGQISNSIDAGGTVQTNAQYTQAQIAQMSQLQGGLGLVNGLLNLENFDDLSTLGQINSLVGLYSNLQRATGSELMGVLPGGLAAGLGFLGALESGDAGSILSSGIVLGDILFEGAVSNAIGAALGVSPASVVPGLNIILAFANIEDAPFTAIGSLFGPIGSIIGGILDFLFGDDDPPPPPEGIVSFVWDAQGSITTQVDFNQSEGAAAAQQLAGSIQSLLSSVVTSLNARTADTSDDVAINPYLIPRAGVSSGSAWIEVDLPNGQTIRESVSGENFTERLISLLVANGGLAPAWQVDTIQMQWQEDMEIKAVLEAQLEAATSKLPVTAYGNDEGYTHGGEIITTVQAIYEMHGSGENSYPVQIGDNSADVAAYQAATAALAAHQARIDRALHAGSDGAHNPEGQAYALQGNSVEAAGWQTQSFGALVIHAQADLNETVNTIRTSEALRDVENDGYFEMTQWIAAADSHGNAQGVLVLDFARNGIIETNDILNLGGNTGTSPTREATLANEFADLQRNNVQWLDANRDGMITAADPAFAAIRLWIDTNQDGIMQSAEGQGMAALSITSINFATGVVSYANGTTNAVSAQTLTADTSGIRLTNMFTGTADESTTACKHYKFSSTPRNIYADYMPILISKFTIKQASNDAHWQQAA